MTTTHLSHFGLTKTHETDTRVYFEGTLADCKRIAFAHGCEIIDEEYRILEMNGTSVITDSTTVTCYWLADQTGEHAGLIHRGRDAWTLAISRAAWTGAKP